MTFDRSKYSRALEDVWQGACVDIRDGMQGGIYVFQCDDCESWRMPEEEETYCGRCNLPWHEYLLLTNDELELVETIVAKRQQSFPLDES